MSRVVAPLTAQRVGSLVAGWWPVEPASASVAASGSNNQTVLLDCPDGRFVARVHHNADVARVRAEHRLLAALAGTSLPFEIPRPLPGLDGSTVRATAYGPVSLVPLLAGERPDPSDPRHQRAAGVALAELDTALGTLRAELAPVVWSGRLDDITPSAPDLDDLCRRFDADPVLASYASWFRGALARHRVPGDLPRQIIHGDYAYSNLLMSDDRVGAVLDFEIAGADLRVNDLVAALAACTHAPDPADDDHVLALCGGFGSVLRVSPAEAHALPDLLRARILGSVVWSAGRWLRGHAPAVEVADRLAAGQAYDVALERHGSRLVDLVAPLLT